MSLELLYPSTYVRADNNAVPTWYEFLLNNDMLLSHLEKQDAEPSGCSLIKQFFDQANRPIKEDGQILPPPDNERNKSVKSLALQSAALLKWDLNLFERSLPIASRHQLLTEFLKVCNTTVPPAPPNGLAAAIKNMHDHSLMALVLYCRWVARTVVKSTFPCQPGGRITPTVPQSAPYQANAHQRCEEVREQILNILKEQVVEIVQLLEAILYHVKRPVFLPGYLTILNQEVCNVINPKDDIEISCEELHAQICFDLGSLHFVHNFYDKALEMFGHTREWLKRVADEDLKGSGFCEIDGDTLVGYHTACLMICKPAEISKDPIISENEGLFLRIKMCLEKKGPALRELGELIIEDVYKKELSTSFLDEVENEVVYNMGDKCGSDTVFDVRWLVAIRRAVREATQPVSLWAQTMNIAQLQRIAGFVQQVSVYLNSQEKERLGLFLCSLANNLSDVSLKQELLSFELTRRLINPDDFNELLLRLNTKKLSRKTMEDESPSSPVTSSTPAPLPTLENDLLLTCDPSRVKQVLAELQTLSNGRKYCNFCHMWELSNLFVTTISSCTSDALVYDLLHILFAKSQILVKDKRFTVAKKFLSYIKDNFTSTGEQKVKRLAGNELLRAELLELLNDKSLKYSDPEECNDLRVQLSDVLIRCRHVLSNTGDQYKSDDLVKLCAATLLNLDDAQFYVNVPRNNPEPCLRLACLLSAVQTSVKARSTEQRKAPNDLWAATMAIYAAPASFNPGSNPRAMKKTHAEPIRNLLPTNAIISRPALISFMKNVKNPVVLQIVVSLLVQLHRLCRTDVLSEITSTDASVINSLWPSSLDGAPTSGQCVTLALRELLAHCSAVQPQNKSWLRTRGDMHYAFKNYLGALRCYLMLGVYNTNYFHDISVTGPYEDDQIIHRMIKCCMQMKCYTQATVFCQMTKDVDYPTAFKALQENRERMDAAEVHYLEHIWDVQMLEHAAFEHRESGENTKKNAAIEACSRPELNHNNTPTVKARVKAFRKARFFQAMARQYLC